MRYPGEVVMGYKRDVVMRNTEVATRYTNIVMVYKEVA